MSDEELTTYDDWAVTRLYTVRARTLALIAEVRRLRVENQAKQDALEMAIRDCTANFEDAERLRQQVDALECTLDDEEAAHQETLGRRAEKPLAWTKEPPTVPEDDSDYYWWRAAPGMPEMIMEVTNSGRSYSVGSKLWMTTADRGGEWAGPLTPPV